MRPLPPYAWLLVLGLPALTPERLAAQPITPETHAAPLDRVRLRPESQGTLFLDGAVQAAPKPWWERLRFSGDFRSRHEGFYQEAHPARNRVRLRLRVRLDTEINDDTSFHLQLASGDPGTPVSTNQTFTEFFLPKPFSLDRGYIAYNPKAAKALTLGLGKFPLPLTKTQMIFDEDLNVEGGWEQVSWTLGKGMGVTLVALQTAVNERSSAGDSFMVGGYGALHATIGRHRVQVSVADYGWGNADQIALGSVGGPLESILTNLLVRGRGGEVLGYASRFNVVDVIGEATLQTGRTEYPLRLAVDVAHNTRASTDRASGVWFEADYGRARAARTWSGGYTYGWIEQDVSPSAFVFSDMPGTNLHLHMLKASVVPLPGLSFEFTMHLTKRLFLERPTDANAWLSRLHTGAVVRF
ncbi:MAG: putative porin [Acidobacteriota bacterium]